VATIVTCAIFATATGIVGAVVTLMDCSRSGHAQGGLQRQGGGGRGDRGRLPRILNPAFVLLIVYGAVAGVSVVQLYAGAFFPGFMLAGLYIGYVIVLAWWNLSLMPPLAASEAERGPSPLPRGRWPSMAANALTGCGEDSPEAALQRPETQPCSRNSWSRWCRRSSCRTAGASTYSDDDGAGGRGQHAGLIEAGGLVAAPEQEREVSTWPHRRAGRIRRQGAFSRVAEAPAPQAARRPRKARPRLQPPGKPPTQRNPNGYRCPSGSGSRSPSVSRSPYSSNWLWSWELGWKYSRCCSPRFFPLALIDPGGAGSIVFGWRRLRGGGNRRIRRFILAGVYRFIA